jgi:hypothetical protein
MLACFTVRGVPWSSIILCHCFNLCRVCMRQLGGAEFVVGEDVSPAQIRRSISVATFCRDLREFGNSAQWPASEFTNTGTASFHSQKQLKLFLLKSIFEGDGCFGPLTSVPTAIRSA